MTDISTLLRRHWGMNGADVRPLAGGINSDTWLVTHRGSTYVAKRVPPTAVADLAAGCESASMLATSGIATGPPVPATDGRLVVTEHAVTLLQHVPGRELDGGTDEEQRWIASTLAAVHRAGSPDLGPTTGGVRQRRRHRCHRLDRLGGRDAGAGSL